MDRNSRFLLKSFRKYYLANAPPMPPRYGRREFGFMFFDRDYVQRHMGFQTPADLRRFMVGQVPSHSYYSTAYYRRPGAPTMDEKEWMGADLIFDLDADHLEGADEMTYAGMLEEVKKEMIRLIDTFLLDDLGFPEEGIQIVFSGGRGYHAHVSLQSVLGLGAQERREIVDYVTSTGLDVDRLFPAVGTANKVSDTSDGRRASVRFNREIPPKNSEGWKKRAREGFEVLVEDVCTLPPQELRSKYPTLGKKNASTVANLSNDLRKHRKFIMENDRMNPMDTFRQELLVETMKEDVVPRLAGEVDEPVTADIKRLIRLPGSVHGRTGLRVVPLTRAELTGFDPFLMAVPEEYSDEPVQITMRRPYEVTLKGERFKLNGTVEVPEYAAVFLVGRREAEIGDGSPDPGPF